MPVTRPIPSANELTGVAAHGEQYVKANGERSNDAAPQAEAADQRCADDLRLDSAQYLAYLAIEPAGEQHRAAGERQTVQDRGNRERLVAPAGIDSAIGDCVGNHEHVDPNLGDPNRSGPEQAKKQLH